MRQRGNELTKKRKARASEEEFTAEDAEFAEGRGEV
jgi:hypothetical protein